MQRMKWELEDLSLKYLDPTAFNEITHSLTEDHIPLWRVYGRMKLP